MTPKILITVRIQVLAHEILRLARPGPPIFTDERLRDQYALNIWLGTMPVDIASNAGGDVVCVVGSMRHKRQNGPVCIYDVHLPAPNSVPLRAEADSLPKETVNYGPHSPIVTHHSFNHIIIPN
jgi:hypothetical protein